MAMNRRSLLRSLIGLVAGLFGVKAVEEKTEQKPDVKKLLEAFRASGPGAWPVNYWWSWHRDLDDLWMNSTKIFECTISEDGSYAFCDLVAKFDSMTYEECQERMNRWMKHRTLPHPTGNFRLCPLSCQVRDTLVEWSGEIKRV